MSDKRFSLVKRVGLLSPPFTPSSMARTMQSMRRHCNNRKPSIIVNPDLSQ
jgi:hypothetical protein